MPKYDVSVTRMVPETKVIRVEGIDEFEAHDEAYDYAWDVLGWRENSVEIGPSRKVAE